MSHCDRLPHGLHTLTDELRALYLDLLKRTLTGAVAEDNDSILGGVRTAGLAVLRKRVAEPSAALVARASASRSPTRSRTTPSCAQNGRDWPRGPRSMIGLQRLDNVQHCVETVIADERARRPDRDRRLARRRRRSSCAAVLEAYGDDDRTGLGRRLVRGPAAARRRRYPADAGDALTPATGSPIVARARCRRNFERYGLLDDQVRFLEGWFKDTLPTAPDRTAGRSCASTATCTSRRWTALTHLYPKLSPGGFLIVDDYGARCPVPAAVHDYRDAHGDHRGDRRDRRVRRLLAKVRLNPSQPRNSDASTAPKRRGRRADDSCSSAHRATSSAICACRPVRW